MQTFRKEIKIIDANRNKFLLDIEVTNRNGYTEFAMSWEWCGSGWQMLDSISPATEVQEKIIQFWRDYHLKQIDEGMYDELMEIISNLLDEQEKNIPITSDDIERLQSILDGDGDRYYSDRQIAIAIMLELSEKELEDDVDQLVADSALHLTIQGNDYYFGTDEQMDDQWIERVENAMDDYLPETINKYWVKNVEFDNGQIKVSMSMILEDRANELASYDWKELQTTIADETYYMYKC